jgi:hypothetical protein
VHPLFDVDPVTLDSGGATNRADEIVARANNLLVGRAAFETARRLYPNERVDYRDGARIIAHSEPEKPSTEMKGTRR